MRPVVLCAVALAVVFGCGLALGQEEATPKSDSHEKLKKLEWLIGEWKSTPRRVNEREYAASYQFRWILDNQFIGYTFQVTRDGKKWLSHSGTIAWDPSDDTIKDWWFNSWGTIGKATLVKAEDHNAEWKDAAVQQTLGKSTRTVVYRLVNGKLVWEATNVRVGEKPGRDYGGEFTRVSK